MQMYWKYWWNFCLMLFLSFFSLPLLLLIVPHFARRALSIRENGTVDPSFRTNRRVSIVERSTRHASSRDACDVNEGRFYYFVPSFVVNSLSCIIDVLISLKFFLLIHMLYLAYRVISLENSFSFFKNTLSPRFCSLIRIFVSLFFLLSIIVCLYLRILGTRVQ